MVTAAAIAKSNKQIMTFYVARILTAAQQLMSFSRPLQADYKSVQTYISNENPLCEGENEWINCKEDIIAFRVGREHAWLNIRIERLLGMFHCKIIEVKDQNRFRHHPLANFNCLTASVLFRGMQT